MPKTHKWGISITEHPKMRRMQDEANRKARELVHPASISAERKLERIREIVAEGGWGYRMMEEIREVLDG